METEGEAASSMAFSRGTPITVKNILTRVLSDERGDTSDSPCFHICSQFQTRLKVDILIPSKDLDCRLSIRTCKRVIRVFTNEKETGSSNFRKTYGTVRSFGLFLGTAKKSRQFTIFT